MNQDTLVLSAANAAASEISETTYLQNKTVDLNSEQVFALETVPADSKSTIYTGVRTKVYADDDVIEIRNDAATVSASLAGSSVRWIGLVSFTTFEGPTLEVRSADVFRVEDIAANTDPGLYTGDRSRLYFRDYNRIVRLSRTAVQALLNAVVPSGGGGGSPATLQSAYDNATTPPQIDVNAIPDAVTFDATVAGDVFAVRDTSNNDILRASTTRLEFGQTVLQEDTLALATPLNYTFDDTFTTGGAFIGGALSSQGNVTYDSAVFIWALLAEGKTYTGAVAPGFAAFTLFNALPLITNSGNFNLVGALVLNAGVTHQRTTSGTSVATNMITVSAANQTRATVSGAVMTRTLQIGLAMSPTFSTVAGSTANLGIIIGMQLNNPSVALFQPGAGAESMVAYYGLVMNAISFGGNVNKAAVLCGLAAASNSYVILNTGTAQSDFGPGSAHWDDNAGIQLGGTTNATNDVLINWNASALEFDFAQNSDVLLVSNPNAGQILFDVGADEYTFNTTRGFSLGAQTGTLGNQFGNFVFGASATQLAGEYSQFLLTQAGNLTIDHAMGGVFAWTVNAPSLSAGTGSVTTAAALNVGGNPGLATVNRVGVRIISNPSGGSGVNAALWVTAGETQLDGVLAHGGSTVGFFGTTPAVQPAAYTPTNVTPDRAYDANATTVNELADVLGTLIADLQTLGLVA